MKNQTVKMQNKQNIYKGETDYTVEGKLFENVVKINDSEYVTIISAWDLAKMWDNEEIVYFADSQRGIKHKKVGNKIREEAIVNQLNILELQSLILSDDYTTDQITLNVLKTGNEELVYDDKDKELLITGVLTVLDGNHRIRASHRAYLSATMFRDDEKINNVKNTLFPVKITHFDIKQARIAFAQLSKGLKISLSRSASFDMTKAHNRICDKLNKKSVLKGLIDTQRTKINTTDKEHLVTFATLLRALKDNFPAIKDEDEENEIYNFLELFFEELAEIFPEMISPEERVISRTYSLVCENIMFYGYLNIAQELYLKRKSKTWKDQLKALSKIDFSKENDIWDCVIKKKLDGYNIINNDKSRSMMCRVLKEQYYANQE